MVITIWREKVAPQPVILTGGDYGDLLNTLQPQVNSAERANTTVRLLDGSTASVGLSGVDVDAVTDIYFFEPLSI